ncbi:MAG: DUF805 domain-containing protein [Pseudomonadota bacterium]
MAKMAAATRRVLSKYATFSGRASRPEFWWWYLSLFLALVITQIIDALLIAPLLVPEGVPEAERVRPLSWLVAMALLLPNLAVGARRLHDIGRTGWWLLIGLIPLIGTIILIYFYIQPSDTERNAYGPPSRL